MTKKKFYSKQVSVADFTLKANIEPNVWLMYQLTARMENKTASESFLTQLRTEMEGLGEGSDSTGNIRIAFIEFENWEANTVTELIKA